MDLKRAWRNGFLALVIFAIPLSDLYNNQYSNLIAVDPAQKARVQHAPKCGTDTPCAVPPQATNDDIHGAATYWGNSVYENDLTIPGDVVTDLLLGSGDADFRDIEKTAIQFDPQDIFQSERIGEDDDDFGSLASLSYGFATPSAFAPGFSGPFTPSMFAPGGRNASTDLRNTSADGSETPFVDPLAGSLTNSETDVANSGAGDESLQNVPEPSSFVLITIGTISVAPLVYRKSKLLVRLS